MSLHQLDGAAPRLAGALLFGILSIFSLSAQDQVATANPEPTISPPPAALDAGSATVQADAWAPTAAATSSDVIVLEGEALKSIKARDLADLLRDVAGVFVSSNGSAGGTQSVSIRGSTTEQVVIIMDGQKLNNQTNGQVNLALLGADNIERIEILRGGASAAYGADAVGGVIYITTKKSKKDSFTVNLESRSYLPGAFIDAGGAWKSPDSLSLVNAQHAAVSGNFGLGGDTRLSVSGAFDHDLGLFLYVDQNGVARRRDQLPTSGGNGSIGLSTPLAGGNFALNLTGQTKRTGVPGGLTYLTSGDYQDDNSVGAVATWKTDAFFSDSLDFDAQVYGNWSELKYYNPTFPGLYQSGTAGFALKQSALLSETVTLAYGLEGRYETLKTQNDIMPSGDDPYRLSGGIYLNPTIKGGGWSFSPAIRLDVFNDVPAGLSATLGIDYTWLEQNHVWLSAARAYRAPTFNELYYADSYGNSGNPNLRPESAWSGEVGVALKTGAISSHSAIFARYVQDGLDWVGLYTSQAQNILAALYPGFDQDISLEFEWFRAGLNYEFLHSYNLSGGYTFASDTRVWRKSEHKLTMRVGAKTSNLEVRLDGTLNGQGFWDIANTIIMPANFVVNANIAYLFSETSSIYFAIDNLLNTSYQINLGYPMPGIGLRVGVNLGF